MKIALDIFTIVAVMAGAFFFLAGTVGLLRFPDPLTRLHALTKADNLGLGLVVLGLLPQTDRPLDTIKLVTIWLFALLAGATVGQLMACAARRGGSNAVDTILPPNGGKSEAKGALRGNTVELSTSTYQIVGRQPFAAETNRMPSRHRDADLPLNSTALDRGPPT